MSIIILLIIFICIFILYNNFYFVESFQLYPFKNIRPSLVINPNSDIAIVYLYTPNILSYCQHSIKNIHHYAKKHNYAFIVFNDTFNDDVSPCWNKVAAILNVLPKYKYVIWMDADAVINNPEIKFESFINKYNNYDLLVCTDIDIEKECINSGILIVKNTSWSNQIFNKIWNSEIVHGHNDQNVIFYEIVKEIYPDIPPDIKFSPHCFNINHPHLKILPENDFNSNIQNYKKNDFIIHLMGCNTNDRINIMRQINTKIGIDNYNYKNNDCLNIIDNYNEYNRKFMIRKTCFTDNT
jgi:hypothetical protein